MNRISVLLASLLLHCGLTDMQEMESAPLNLYATKNDVKKFAEVKENVIYICCATVGVAVLIISLFPS